jgi:hypothetical protein
MRATLFMALFFTFTSIGQAANSHIYSCIDRKTNAKHIVTVIPGYKLVNTINTGYSFDYSLDYINQNELHATLYMNKANERKKFTIKIDRKNLVMHDTMHMWTYTEKPDYDSLEHKKYLTKIDSRIFDCKPNKTE